MPRGKASKAEKTDSLCWRETRHQKKHRGGRISGSLSRELLESDTAIHENKGLRANPREEN